MNKTKRIKLQTSKFTSDCFQTDPRALNPLLPYLDPDWLIWETACGRGKLANFMRFNGFDVTATDIACGVDFLEKELPHDCSITNPPFSVKDQWIARCYELDRPFALLMPYTALEGLKRQPLYREHGLGLLFLPKRVKFTTPNGKVGGAWFPVAWFTWKILPDRIIFAE